MVYKIVLLLAALYLFVVNIKAIFVIVALLFLIHYIEKFFKKGKKYR